MRSPSLLSNYAALALRSYSRARLSIVSPALRKGFPLWPSLYKSLPHEMAVISQIRLKSSLERLALHWRIVLQPLSQGFILSKSSELNMHNIVFSFASHMLALYPVFEPYTKDNLIKPNWSSLTSFLKVDLVIRENAGWAAFQKNRVVQPCSLSKESLQPLMKAEEEFIRFTSV